jgi:transglutaminase-like putative cysteine protease
MFIRLGYDLQFYVPAPLSYVAQLHVHPSRVADLREPDIVHLDGDIPSHEYSDTFGNLCTRFVAPAGNLRIHNSTLIYDSGLPDPPAHDVPEVPIDQLPDDVLRFLLASRYCEVDLLSPIAFDLFGHLPKGGSRVHAIVEWVNQKVKFGYAYARSTKTALDVYTERLGVCRDFQHLAVTFCRALNIPARYVAGYLGDIGVAYTTPMDFSAWFEAYLDGKWWTFDARHNRPRVGRVLMATGRDAADVAFLTSFGGSTLTRFEVTSDEVPDPDASTPSS